MSKIRQPSISPIKLRKQQIEKEINKIREHAVTKTRRHFKTDKGFEAWQRKWPEKINELEQELSILNDPGEYDELPVALVAEELGVSSEKISSLLRGGELEQSDESKKDYVSRAELERALEVGVEELLRLSSQEPDEIFEEAIGYVHAGDLKRAEKAYLRIEARDSYRGMRVPALGIALELLKGDIEGAQFSLRLWLDMDQTNLATLFAYLGRLLRGLKLSEHGAQAICEHILAIADGANVRPYDYLNHRAKRIGKHLDETQQRAMYLAAAVQNSLKKYRHVQQFKFYHERSSQMRDEEFEVIIRNAIYTALHAEATYEESAASRFYVNSIKSLLPRWWAPADLLEHLLPKKKEDISDNKVDS
jgi:hypothetical protein